MEARAVTLAHKPGASLRISSHLPALAERGPFANTLVVFINGLGLPRASWAPAAIQLIASRRAAGQPVPPLLAYDRYGQGESEPDPSDAPDTPYGHDARVAVDDLHLLVERVCRDADGLGAPDPATVRLVLVGNSIGCPLARLYAAAHPGCVEGLLLLDSMIANTDFVSVFPDPDAPGSDPAHLAPGVSPDDLRHVRAMAAKVFSPSVPNKERLDRRNLPELLPRADGPPLPDGPDGRPPLLVVVGHDPDTFADESAQGFMKAPKPATHAYLNTHWAAYNTGLTKIAESAGVKIAKGCGHFIQKDDPEFVAAELSALLNDVVRRRSA